jgi:hypothetical protein
VIADSAIYQYQVSACIQKDQPGTSELSGCWEREL